MAYFACLDDECLLAIESMIYIVVTLCLFSWRGHAINSGGVSWYALGWGVFGVVVMRDVGSE